MQSSVRRSILASSLLLVVLACSAGQDAATPDIIEADELAARIASGDAPLVLDVRTPEEFAAGHIPGAVNIPHSELADRIDEIAADPSAEIVVHCQSGRRAKAAESVLAEAGFTGVRDLAGHMAGWREGGHPVE